MTKRIPRISTVLLTALLVLGVTNVGWSATKSGVIGCTANQAGRSGALSKGLVLHYPPGDPQVQRMNESQKAFTWTYALANVNRGGRWQVVSDNLADGKAQCIFTGTVR
ncbi:MULTISPECIES: hypothetical protein [unclassified Schaalia]|uniref:hypothetical protein n=1 Tax=unclassified Schaalia TaxID=2691889 RepID=UPI001E4DEBE0|nr:MULTISPECIES: hypothetical protein [unclassified Schaalia]MCD4549408.1 hypothetical protein [Schaalia sp. lx-260]MCD4557969.1 hypothetical protein [Schaalia sp. lx-100]